MTFIERYYRVQRTNKANKTRRTEWESAELSGEFMEYHWNSHKDSKRHKNRILKKKSGQAGLVYVWNINHNIPTMWGWSHRVLQPDALQVLYFEWRQLPLQLTSQQCWSVFSPFHDCFARNEVKLESYRWFICWSVFSLFRDCFATNDVKLES